jgi:hypothetical protein
MNGDTDVDTFVSQSDFEVAEVLPEEPGPVEGQMQVSQEGSEQLEDPIGRHESQS